jgi:uncharacterized membrane protein (UPF0127 family)
MKIILLADNDDKRRNGLMHHQPISLQECAFFKFPYEGKHSFWNKNVDFPISLIFANKNMEVEDVKYLDKQQRESVSPDSYNIKYVVEAHKDAPELYKIKKGSKINIKNGEVSFK